MRNAGLAGWIILCGMVSGYPALAAGRVILRPVAAPPPVEVAARGFQKDHEAVTGVRLEIMTAPDAVTDV